MFQHNKKFQRIFYVFNCLWLRNKVKCIYLWVSMQIWTTNVIWSYALWRYKTELSQIVRGMVNFSLIFRNSEFLMKIKFLSCVTRKFYLYLITMKFPSYTTREFKFNWKFWVTSLKESFKSLPKVLCEQLWLT